MRFFRNIFLKNDGLKVSTAAAEERRGERKLPQLRLRAIACFTASTHCAGSPHLA